MADNGKEKKGLVTNLASYIAQRAGLAQALGKQFGGKRDLFEALGYKKEPDYNDYYAHYDRTDIAGRIVDMPPSATWRNVPTIKEDTEADEPTEFEQAWAELCDRLRVWHYFERVDRLAGIGHYAVLLIGVRGNTDLSLPIEEDHLDSPEDIIYLTPYSERTAEIVQWETDPGTPRFGQPLYYRITLGGDDPNISGFHVAQKLVHHSRVIHVAEGLLEDDVFGRPRLKRVLNRLDDLVKVVGGSAEMFWQGAFKGLHADVRDEASFDPTGFDAEQVAEEIDEYIHDLRRYIRTQGIDLKTLGGETADPTGVFDPLISLIAGSSGIPKRILLGSERGELASSQDQVNFNAYISERQNHFAEPMVLRPFIDKLINIGALPEPENGSFMVEWPNLFEVDDATKAQIASTMAGTLQQYAADPMAEEIVPIPEFREKFLGLDRLPSQEDLQQLEQRLEEDFEHGDDTVSPEFENKVRRQR